MGSSLRKSVLGDDLNLEIYSLVWLDASVNATAENLDVQDQLRTLINHLKTFDNVKECLHYIKNISKQNRIVLIVSGRLGREIIPHIHRLRQISSIYVYCMDKEKNEKWTSKFPKIRGVIVNLQELVGHIRTDRARRSFCKLDEPFSFNLYQKQSNAESNNHFLHAELLCDCLLRMKCNGGEKGELLSLCREIYRGNKSELAVIEEFEQNYTSNRALWWYTRDSFVSRLLNKAFQEQTIDLLYLFRFFIRDIENQLVRNRCPWSIRVYRGQYLSYEELQTLQNSIGGFLSMNFFLAASLNRTKALRYIREADDLRGVLFEIDADPRAEAVKPFSQLKSLSYVHDDDEVLFMIGSIFRIDEIHSQQDETILIRLTLCSDNDPQLKTIFQPLKTTIKDGETNLLSFGDVLWKIGKFNQAEKYYQLLLTELSDDHSQNTADCYYALGNIAMEKDECQSSLELHLKSLEIKKQTLKTNDPSLADSYSSLADLEHKQGHSTQALEYNNQALTIWTEAYGDSHPKIAVCLNNIGCIYGEEKNFLQTLACYEKALLIMEKHFSSDHPCLGQAQNNMGSVHRHLGNYQLALKHYQLSLAIKTKSFSSKHPTIASTCSHIGHVYEDMTDFQQALVYYEKAAAIYRNRLPPTHPDNLQITEDIRRVCSQVQ